MNFGIDLRRWSGDYQWRDSTGPAKREKGAIPDVIRGLLAGLEELYTGISEDGESFLVDGVNLRNANNGLLRTSQGLDL